MSDLAAGGTSRVWVVHSSRGQRFAAKAPSNHRFELTPEMHERLRREAIALGEVDHPNVIRVHDVIDLEATVVTILELVEGGTLREYLDHFGRMSDEQAARVVAQVLSGLEAVHELDIVHRDLSPKNIMLARNGTVRIIDFGAVRLPDRPQITTAQDHIGSLLYIAPEQFESASAVDARSDIYSLGQVWLELLTDRPPLGSGPGLATDHAEPFSGLMGMMRSYSPAGRPSASLALEHLERRVLREVGKNHGWLYGNHLIRKIDSHTWESMTPLSDVKKVADPSVKAACSALTDTMDERDIGAFERNALRPLLARVHEGEFEPATERSRLTFLANLVLLSDNPSHLLVDFYDPEPIERLYDTIRACEPAHLDVLAQAFGSTALDEGVHLGGFYALHQPDAVLATRAAILGGVLLPLAATTGPQDRSHTQSLWCLDCGEEIGWDRLPGEYRQWCAFQCKCPDKGATDLSPVAELAVVTQSSAFLTTPAIRELVLARLDEELTRGWDWSYPHSDWPYERDVRTLLAPARTLEWAPSRGRHGFAHTRA